MKTKVHTWFFYLGAFVLAALCFTAVKLVSAESSIAAPTARQRLVKRWAFASEPVSVRGLQAKGASIESNKPFAATDDWLKGLRFDVENTSLQSIAFVKVHVLLYGVKGYEGALSIPLQWGEPPLLKGGEVISKPVNALAPGGSLTLAVTEEMYTHVKGMVEKSDSMANVSEARLLTSSVMFADGTVWKGGSLLYPDETRAGVWKERKDDLSKTNSYLASSAGYGHANIIRATPICEGCLRVTGSIFINCCSGECFMTPERATFASDKGCATRVPVTLSCQPCSIQTCLTQEAAPCYGDPG
ncbi:MAG TPA: hypothetical protein VGC89_15370 [Pyrinomonadaceae bacterium]|jgi:hypothetical protein